MNVLGFTQGSSNVFDQDLDTTADVEFDTSKVNTLVLKGQDTDVANLEADNGVVFYDRVAKRAKISTSDGVASTTKTLVDLVDLDDYLDKTTGGVVQGSLILNDGLSANNAPIVANAGIDAANTSITNVTDPTNPQDAATKNYVDNGSFLPLAGGTMTGDIQNLRTNDIAIHLGANAGITGQQQLAVAIGGGAGATNQSQKSVAIGSSAGRINQSTRSTAIGEFAGYREQGEDSVAIGQDAGREFQGDFCIAVGCAAGKNNQPQRSIVLAAGPTDTVPSTSNEMIFRAGATTFVANTLGITYQGNSIAGDFKSDGSVPMSGGLIVPTINGLSPTGGKWASTAPNLIVHQIGVTPQPFQSLFGPTGVGTLTVVANGWAVGTTGSIKIGGVLTVPNNADYAIRITGGNGTVELWNSGPQQFAAAVTDQYWEIELEFTIRELGNTAVQNLGFNGSFRYLTDGNNMEGLSIVPPTSDQGADFDTTVAQTFGVEMQLSTIGSGVNTHVASLSTLY